MTSDACIRMKSREEAAAPVRAVQSAGEHMWRSVTLASGVLAVSVLLSGCALLGGGAGPLDTYELTAASPSETRGRSNRQILIAEPSALKAFDGENIVITPSPGVIQYLKGAQWADRLPKIVQARLAETFQHSGRFRGVGRP